MHGHTIPWVGTSWKMHKTRAEARSFASALKASNLINTSAAKLFIIPPFTALADVAAALANTKITIGAQNMHWADQGAWTGEISAPMIKDCGATLVEIGHSERRRHFGETDETVALKTANAVKNGLTALVCIGDTREEFETGITASALERQVRALLKYVKPDDLKHVVIAYEPVWSIGEGGTPASPEFANDQHSKIATLVKDLTGDKLPILYGGSVHAENCVSLASQSHIDGLFIGRAAWAPEDYLDIVAKIIKAHEPQS
jgi:L-erythrulose 1-phosphate isomerase